MKALFAAMLSLFAQIAFCMPLVLTDFGADPNGVADSKGAFDAAVAAACRSPDTRTVLVPVGKFIFFSAPARIPCALNLIGEGTSVTRFIREYASPESFLLFTGGEDPYGGGTIRDMTLDAGHFSGGIALWVQAQPESDPTIGSMNPHGLLVDNVFIGAGIFYPQQGSWAYGVYLDGSLNSNPPSGVAPGIRLIRLRSMNISRVSILPVLLYYARGTRISDVDCFIPIGSGQPMIYIMNDLDSTRVTSASCLVIRK